MFFRLLMITLAGILTAVASASENERCTHGSAEDRLACFTRVHCPVVTSEADRSQCYRDIVLTLLNAQTTTADPSPAAPEVASASPPVASVPVIEDSSEEMTVNVNPESEFGYEWQQTQQRQESVDEITSTIVFLEKLARGNYLVGLENGQLWQQVARSRTRLKLGETVRITRGSLRSFRLIPEKSTPTNVSRVVCHGDEASSLCAAFEQGKEPAASITPGAG